jgi:hypothetical protein
MLLHVHNGESAAGTARQSNIPGRHISWQEAFTSGPTPAGLSRDESIELRAAFLSGESGRPPDEVRQQLLDQERIFDDIAQHEEVVLWFEHDLFCQSMLVYLLNRLSLNESGEAKISLICIGEFPGKPDFRGLGELNADELASLFDKRREVTQGQFQLAAKAWGAYSAPTPEPIEQLLSQDTTALPYLAAAFRKHLERFPSVLNGLGLIENKVLEMSSTGKTNFSLMFIELMDSEPLFGTGDAGLVESIKRLVDSRDPLLKMAEAVRAGAESSKFHRSAFEITQRGQAILAGEEDFIDCCGIDLWLGGVHLKDGNSIWRWDGQQQKLVGPE